jgi:hypothetical protein
MTMVRAVDSSMSVNPITTSVHRLQPKTSDQARIRMTTSDAVADAGHWRRANSRHIGMSTNSDPTTMLMRRVARRAGSRLPN